MVDLHTLKQNNSVFSQALDIASSSHDIDTATKIALGVINNRNKKDVIKHTIKGSLTSPRVYHTKSLAGNASVYFADFIFADTSKDLDGDMVPNTALLDNITGYRGDLEHSRLYPELGFPQDDLFVVDKAYFDGTRLIGSVRFFDNHPMFGSVWEKCKTGDFGISMEYADNWKIVGISGTTAGRNPGCKVLRAYAQ